MKAGEFLNTSLSIEDIPSPRVVTIVGYEAKQLENQKGSKDLVLFLKLAEFQKTLRCNKTNVRRLVDIFGTDDIDHWTGRSCEIFQDPSLAYREKPAGVGVRAMTPPIGSVPPAAQAVADAVGGTVVEHTHQSQQLPPSDLNGYKDF